MPHIGDLMMKLTQAVFICICLLLPSSAQKETRGWRGIIPLRSTREDVERLLGASEDACRCLYKTERDVVHIDYAVSPCKGHPAGWNVPAHTVLRITVRSKTQQPISDLKLDEDKYVKSYDDTMTAYYTSRDKGLRYEVSPKGDVTAVSYIPATTDRPLRCPGFPADDGSARTYRPVDAYADISFADERARLDIFAFQLEQDSATTGYIIAYAGRRARVGEARARVERARSYLVTKRGIKAQRIVTIDGGYREERAVELYLLSNGAPPPVAQPTLAPSEVQIIKGGKGRNTRSKSTLKHNQH